MLHQDHGPVKTHSAAHDGKLLKMKDLRRLLPAESIGSWISAAQAGCVDQGVEGRLEAASARARIERDAPSGAVQGQHHPRLASRLGPRCDAGRAQELIQLLGGGRAELDANELTPWRRGGAWMRGFGAPLDKEGRERDPGLAELGRSPFEQQTIRPTPRAGNWPAELEAGCR